VIEGHGVYVAIVGPSCGVGLLTSYSQKVCQIFIHAFNFRDLDLLRQEIQAWLKSEIRCARVLLLHQLPFLFKQPLLFSGFLLLLPPQLV